MNLRHCIALMALVLCAVGMSAQRTMKVQAEYTYVAPPNVTVEQAKMTALDRAKIQVIADNFGTLVTQSNSTVVKNTSGHSSIDFLSLGSSEVKGEWIETIGEPKYSISYEDEQLVVKVSVSGRIREIVSAEIDLKVKVLCNGTSDKFERTDFMNGDDLYLSFQSPVDGFLTVYLIDPVAKTAYCLLPYRASNVAAQPIRRDTPYTFFSQKEAAGKEKSIVDEYTMTCSSGQERNDLYIIFSPNEYAKANSAATEESLLRQMEWGDFVRWLDNGRKKDPKMQCITKTLTIKN